MMVRGAPSRITVWPRISSRPPYCFCQAAVAEHHGAGAAGPVLVIAKIAAKCGCDAERAEEAVADARALCCAADPPASSE